MMHCKLCNGEMSMLLNLGAQPITSRFLQNPTALEYKHNLSLGQCQNCALVQLIDFPPAEELKPIYDWITYREEEDHLDKVADMISNLPAINHSSKIMGISYKDDSLLERLRRRGFYASSRLDPYIDLNIIDNHVGVEVVQGKLTTEIARKFVQQHGQQDLVIVRHILEHAHQIKEFTAALHILTKPDGYVVVEVPDCSKAIDLLDYSIIWEEHLFYFTPVTFKNALAGGQFFLFDYQEYVFPFENCLVSIWKPINNITNVISTNVSNKIIQDFSNESKRATIFFNSFLDRQKAIKEFLSDCKINKGNIALLGAGHLAASFINYFDLREEISFVVDDNPVKQGLLLAGSLLPIVSSTALLNDTIKVCLLGLNPRKEDLIIQKNQQFINRGGKFFSIFSESKNRIPIKQQNLKLNPAGFNQLSFRNKELTIDTSTALTGFKKTADTVFSADTGIVKISSREINFITDIAMRHFRNMARICAHDNIENSIHEMMIVLGKETYIRPHKHPGKSESFHIIKGLVEVIIFNNHGKVIEIIELGEYPSGKNFYYRLSEPYFHTVRALSDVAVFHETTNGPFNKIDTEFALWAPGEEGWEKVKKFMKSI